MTTIARSRSNTTAAFQNHFVVAMKNRQSRLLIGQTIFLTRGKNRSRGFDWLKYISVQRFMTVFFSDNVYHLSLAVYNKNTLNTHNIVRYDTILEYNINAFQRSKQQ